MSSAGAVPAGSTSPVVVDLNGLRVASVPLPGFALHEVKGGRASLIASGSTTWCGTSTQRGTRRGAGGPRPGRRRPGLPSPGVGGTARRVRVHHFPAEERDSLLVVASQSRDWLPSHGRPPPSLGAALVDEGRWLPSAVASRSDGGEGRVRLDPAPADVLGGGG